MVGRPCTVITPEIAERLRKYASEGKTQLEASRIEGIKLATISSWEYREGGTFASANRAIVFGLLRCLHCKKNFKPKNPKNKKLCASCFAKGLKLLEA